MCIWKFDDEKIIFDKFTAFKLSQFYTNAHMEWLLKVIHCEINSYSLQCILLILMYISDILKIMLCGYTESQSCSPILVTTVITFIEVSCSDWSRMVIWSYWHAFHFCNEHPFVFMRVRDIHSRTSFVILWNAFMKRHGQSSTTYTSNNFRVKKAQINLLIMLK